MSKPQLLYLFEIISDRFMLQRVPHRTRKLMLNLEKYLRLFIIYFFPHIISSTIIYSHLIITVSVICFLLFYCLFYCFDKSIIARNCFIIHSFMHQQNFISRSIISALCCRVLICLPIIYMK